jgi:hypothetical protein
MSTSPGPRASLSSRQQAALAALVADLRREFGTRLRSAVAYGLETVAADGELRTLVLVDTLTADDLHRLAPTVPAWRRLGLAVPLLLTPHEFTRTLDVFPLEYGHIIDTHVVLDGADPFAGLEVPEPDRRRGCEREAKSHLIHLREGALETEGDPRRLARLIARSAPAFRAMLANIVRLERGDRAAGLDDDDALAEAAQALVGVPAAVVTDVLGAAHLSAAADPSALMSRYIESTERIWRFVDGWRS